MKNKMVDPLDRIINWAFILAVITVIVLKIIGAIKIPWIWLLSPLWILFLIGCLLAIILAVTCIISIYIENKKENK